MYIDSHQHFWNYDPKRDAWITDQMSAIQRDFTPEDLEGLLKQNNIDGCVAVQSDQSEEETHFLLSLADKYDFIKGVVGWVDLHAENLKGRLSYFSGFEKFKGIRHIVQEEPLGFMDRPEFVEGIRSLDAFDKTYDILIKPPQLAEAIRLVEKFPDQKFVLDHIAKPRISKGLNQKWASEIRELASHTNLYCKVSGMVTETDDFNWDSGDFTVFLEFITATFGTDRIMFGSDWPVCLLAASYQQVKSIITDFYSPLELDKIMGENAVRFYKL